MAGIRHKSRFDIEIDIQKEKLKKIEEANNIFHSLREDGDKLKALENSWFSRLFRRETIDDTRKNIAMKNTCICIQGLEEMTNTEVQNLKDYVRNLEKARTGRMEYVLWHGFPERLDGEINEKYLQRFRNVQPLRHGDIQFVNVTMFGGLGVGKSSFLNTVVTALMNNPNRVFKDYKTAHHRSGQSKTKTFHCEKIQVEGTRDLPIRFYDCPGIDQKEKYNMNLDVIEAVINGHVKGNAKIEPEKIKEKNEECYRKYPSPKDAMHCIVFVIKATSHVEEDKTLRRMKEIQKKFDAPHDVKQVAIVTNIDMLGVPNSDMENVFKYSCVKEICQEVSDLLEIELQSVHPVANYHEEIEPTAAKNVLALMALWDIFECGDRHIQQKLERRFDDDN